MSFIVKSVLRSAITGKLMEMRDVYDSEREVFSEFCDEPEDICEVIELQPNGTWRDITAEFLAELSGRH